MIKLGTRGSQLATSQSQTIADALGELGVDVELTIIRSEGDNQKVALNAFKRPGAFVARLQEAVIDGSVDMAVHSFKDLPSAIPQPLITAAVPKRASERDVLVTRDGLELADLPKNAKVGTSSPRRQAALLRARPDLQIFPIRGNVDTRLNKARNGELDAVVLAEAGLQRLGLLDENMTRISLDVLLPAPAQGALAVECRGDNEDLVHGIGKLDHLESRVVVSAERAILTGVDAACTTAVGAHAQLDGNTLTLRADLANWRGVDFARAEHSIELPGDPKEIDETQKALWCEKARELGLKTAAELLAQAQPNS